ncbi:hypothetical protein NFX39_01760 [Fructobacillus sp. W13]|uniref:Uncharacterized protein n=1 Tax=Fructobacillus apis TaxID=2935017 RepID=A0ABT0ZPA2_9LACO|nr:hypothetical protein [Fructobacillus apis]MCO0831820.1 hypothetical protein [Fructobacillus apis]
MFQSHKIKIAFTILVIIATASLVFMTQDSKPKSHPDHYQDQNRDVNAQQSSSSSDKLSYYSGQKVTHIPMTDGTVDNGATYWTAKMTIDGKKTTVVASYYRMGYFSIYTKQPTNKIQSFTYKGDDYQKFIGAKDLDEIASKSEPYNY